MTNSTAPPQDPDGNPATPPADRPDSARPVPGAPLWVKVSAGLALAVIVLLAVLLLLGGGGHGPGRHTASGGAGGHSAPAGFPDHGAQQR